MGHLGDDDPLPKLDNVLLRMPCDNHQLIHTPKHTVGIQVNKLMPS